VINESSLAFSNIVLMGFLILKALQVMAGHLQQWSTTIFLILVLPLRLLEKTRECAFGLRVSAKIYSLSASADNIMMK